MYLSYPLFKPETHGFEGNVVFVPLSSEVTLTNLFINTSSIDFLSMGG